MSGIEQGWGLLVILWFQAWRTGVVGAIAKAFHYAGSEEAYLVILPFIYWCLDAALGRRVTLFFLVNTWANSLFKEWWKRPRPYQVSGRVRPLVTEDSYGLPSGHAQNAAALWGALALHFKKNWLTWAAAAFVTLMAISRMVLGVHFPQDVIGGVVIGLILLALYAWLEPKITPWINRQSLPAQIGVVAAASAAMLLVHPILLPVSSNPATNTSAASAVGVFLGGGIGIALETRSVRFEAGGVWWKRLARLAIGLAVALELRFWLGAIFTNLQPELVVRLVRYGLIGLWVAYGAPWVFVKTGLAAHK